MDNGYVKLYRSLLKWEWFQSPNTFHLWIYILLSANWEDRRFQGIEIPKGSMIRTLKEMSQETGLTVSQVRTAIDHLKSTGEITTRLANKSHIITVEKWGDFQSDVSEVSNIVATCSQDNRTELRSKEYKEIKNKELNINNNANNSCVTDTPKKTASYVPPTIEEVRKYIEEKGYTDVDADVFWNYYNAANWYRAKGVKLTKWKSAVALWHNKNKQKEREEFF